MSRWKLENHHVQMYISVGSGRDLMRFADAKTNSAPRNLVN